MVNSYNMPRSTPEEQGISSTAIISFLDAIEKNKLELHSFMLVRHGYIVAEGWWAPYRPEYPHSLFSLSKSFTSTAVGFAIAEGLLSINDSVVSFFPEDTPEVIDKNLASMQIKHLLTMSTGHAKDTVEYLLNDREGNWVKAFLELPVDYEPGTHFVYNSGASYMLSAIVQKVTGQTLLEYLKPRLFEPLGIENPKWEICPKGINTGGWGLSLKTEDIAKFGQTYLSGGIYNGKQIIPPEWVKEATAKHIDNGSNENSDWEQGYGYQFWRCRHNAYRGDGAFGQFCVIMPEQDAVIAITSGLEDMQAVLNQIWENILPGMVNDHIPPNKDSHEMLLHRLSTLALNPPNIKSHSQTAGEISGKHYVFEENDIGINAISLEFDDEICQISLWKDSEKEKLICGIGKWVHGEITTPNIPLVPKGKVSVVTAGTWSDKDTFIITCRLIETPFYITTIMHFDNDQVKIESKLNVSFGQKEFPTIYGKIM